MSNLEQQHLGRWKIESEYKTNLKADYANDDHSGVCFTANATSDMDDETYYSMFLIESVQDYPIIKK
jgi:hypothetical protein